MRLPPAYYEAVFKAGYYRWNAQRGFSIPGNDPCSGRPKDPLFGWTPDRDAYRAAHKAMARVYLETARRIRCLIRGEAV